MTDGEAGPDDIVADSLFGGRLALRQFRQGHRAGTDAVLLAAAAGVEPGDRFVDVGAGSGAVGLWLALREPRARGRLLERDAGAAALAMRNVEANGLQDQVAVDCGDLFDGAACRAMALPASASLVVTNPPFFLEGQVRASPDPAKAAAHVLAGGAAAGHAAWLRRAVTFLDPRGRLVLIHRPEALPALLAEIGPGLGGVVLRAIHAKAREPAIRVLLGLRRGTKAPMVVQPGLVLHEDDGGFAPEAALLHDGQPMRFWPK